MPDWKGFTIHAGWIPQLLVGSPKRKWSSTNSPSGITVRGYNKEFVTQIRNLGQQKEQELLDNQSVLTRIGRGAAMAATGVISDDRVAPYAAMLLRLGKREHRGLAWRDMVDSASEYQARSKAMSIRGQTIWYMLGTTGPKEMAQRLIQNNRNNQPFNFRKAERWYEHTANTGLKGHAEWAQKTLGIHPNEIDRTVSVADVLSKGDAAEELVYNQSSNKETMFTDKSVPANPEGTARGRDIRAGGLDIESTEELKYKDQRTKGHHGLPDGYLEDAFGGAYVEGTSTEEEWENFMNNQVINTWNDFAAAALSEQDSTLPQQERTLKASDAVTGTSAANSERLAVNAASGMSLQQLRKMKHEFAAAELNSMSGDFASTWREGIPLTDRDPATGERTYASTTLALNNEFRFSVERVEFLRGINHSLSTSAATGASANAANYYSGQQNHFAHSSMNNSAAARSINGITRQVQDSLLPTGKVNVSFSVADGKAWLEKVVELVGREMVKRSKDRSQAIHDKLSKKTRTYDKLFWALPYISIEEGLYKG